MLIACVDDTAWWGRRPGVAECLHAVTALEALVLHSLPLPSTAEHRIQIVQTRRHALMRRFVLQSERGDRQHRHTTATDQEGVGHQLLEFMSTPTEN